jgi:hypothetical protein
VRPGFERRIDLGGLRLGFSWVVFIYISIVILELLIAFLFQTQFFFLQLCHHGCHN